MKWENIALNQLIKAHYGKALKADDRDASGSIPVYGSSGKVGSHTTALIDYPTLIIGRKGSVGEIIYAEQGGWPIDTVFYTQILNPNQVYLRYLFYALKRANLARWTITTSIPGLNRNDLYATKIPLPPIEEQRRIAAILDMADGVRRKRKEAIALTEELLRSVFLDMFGDPVTNPKGWETISLGEELDFITSGSRGWAKYYSDEGKRFIRSLDVRMNYIADDDAVFVNPPDNAEAKRTQVQDGDVLLTITGSRIGRVSSVPRGFGDAYISQHVAIIRPKEKINPIYLSFYLSLPSGGQRQIENMQYGQTKPGLNLTQISNFQIPLPPTDKQNKFIDFWNKQHHSLNRECSALEDTDNLFNSLLQRAFRGEL